MEIEAQNIFFPFFKTKAKKNDIYICHRFGLWGDSRSYDMDFRIDVPESERMEFTSQGLSESSTILRKSLLLF